MRQSSPAANHSTIFIKNRPHFHPSKHRVTGEWRVVTHQHGRKPKARPKAVTGTASLAEFEDLAGPEQFCIGNTRASTDEAKVKEVLQKCAESLKVDAFTVENVFCLTKESVCPCSLQGAQGQPRNVPTRLESPGLPQRTQDAGGGFSPGRHR